jgi:hypothetical protein
MKHYMVYRMPRSTTFGVYETSTGYNRLVEGGFFSRLAANMACERLTNLARGLFDTEDH